MNIAKALAVSAVAGMLMGATAACGGGSGATPGATDPSAAGGKSSCSANGDLNFNWRLALAPEPVLRHVVIHELGHQWFPMLVGSNERLYA